MLSPYILDALDRTLAKACRWAVLPCIWDGNRKILTSSDAAWRRLGFKCVSAFLAFQAAFRFGRFLHSLLTNTFDPNLVFLQFFFVAASTMVLALNANTKFYELEYCQGWTLFYRYERKLASSGEYVSMGGKTDIPGRAVKFYIYFILIQGLSQVGIYLTKSQLPIYVYSLLVGSRFDTILIKMLFIVPEAMGVIIFWMHCTLYALPGLSQLYMCSFWLKQIRFRWDLEQIQRFMISYRSFQILWTCFNQGMRITVITQKVFTIVLASTSLYGSVRQFGTVPIADYSLMPFSFVGCVAVGVFLDPWGYIIEKHIRQVKVTWKSRIRGQKYLRHFDLFLKSAKPLTVNMGLFYTFGRRTLVTFLTTIMDITFSLLIAL